MWRAWLEKEREEKKCSIIRLGWKLRTEFEFYGAEKKKKTKQKKKREETPRRRKSDKKCKMEGGGGEGRTNWTQDRKNDKMTNHGLKEFGKKTSLGINIDRKSQRFADFSTLFDWSCHLEL